MTDLLPRMNDRKILFMCPHRDWKNCPLLGIQNGRRYKSEDVTGWKTQPRIVRKLAENRVRCQATLELQPPAKDVRPRHAGIFRGRIWGRLKHWVGGDQKQTKIV